MRSTQQTLSEFVAHLDNARPRKDSFKATCPVCKTYNLVVSPRRDNSGIVLHCFYANCAANQKGGGLAVLDALGLTTDALFNEDRQPREKDPDYHGRLIATRQHVYTNDDGSVYATKEIRKYEDGHKRAYWTHTEPDAGGHDQRVYGMPAKQPPLYHADKLTTNRTGIVFAAEGERDADSLTGLIGSIPATSLYAGAETKWSVRWNGYFNGRYAVIFSDNDGPGQRYAEMIAAGIANVARGVMILPAVDLWEQLPPKGDISDVIDHFGPEHVKAAVIARMMRTWPDATAAILPPREDSITRAYAVFSGRPAGLEGGVIHG